MKVDYSFLRPMKSEAVKGLHEKKIGLKEELSVVGCNNAVILPVRICDSDDSGNFLLFGRGGVIEENGRYLHFSGIEGRVGGHYEYDKPVTENKKVVFCGFMNPGWGHFLVEGICRLWYALKGDVSVDKYIFINYEGCGCEIKGNFRIFLELLGIFDKVELIDKPRGYKEVIVPELAFSAMNYYSKEYQEIFDKIISSLPASKESCSVSRVFLSRGHLYDKKHFYGRKHSREMGLDMLDEYFSTNGYKVIYPERTDLIEMLILMRDAEEIASESGSCAHNMLLAPKGSKTLIMERQAIPNRFQACIDIVRDLDTVYVDAYYALYPTADFGGPYLLMFTPEMESFTCFRNYTAPPRRFLTDAYKRKAVKWFIMLYKHLWGERLWWGDEIDSVTDWAEVFKEVNEESYNQLRRYIDTPLKKMLWMIREKYGY